MRLYREVRCYLSPQTAPESRAAGLRPRNSWAGTNQADAYGLFWQLAATVDGPVDPRTGYLCNIKRLDELLRGPAAETLLRSLSPSHTFDLRRVSDGLGKAFGVAAEACPKPARLHRLTLAISPFTRLAIESERTTMAKLTQSFEFSAAHRLYCADLSDDENRRLFGKCSNPSGHGHNYVLEVTVEGIPADEKGTVTDLAFLDRVVRERVVDPFDHRNLNTECPEFATLNPTVENIARVIWTRLHGAFAACRLDTVRVWETPRTYAEYSGE